MAHRPGYNFDAGLQVVKQLNLNTMRTFVVVVVVHSLPVDVEIKSLSKNIYIFIIYISTSTLHLIGLLCCLLCGCMLL